MADETEIKFRFTPKGQQVSAAILGGKDKIEFTKAAASIDVHTNDTDADVANIVDLDNKKQTVDIHDVVAVKDNVVQIPISFEKNKVTEDYQMNTIGIYAKYQGQEFLYAFGALKYPLYMHHTDDSGVFKMYTYITVGTVANVVIKTDNTENVSRDDLNKILADYPTKGDLAGKANLTDVYTKDQVNNLVAGAGQTRSVNNRKPDSTGNIDLGDLFDQKADKSSVYTKDETYTKAEINEKVGDQVHSVTVNGHRANANGDIDLSDIFDQKVDLTQYNSDQEKITSKINGAGKLKQISVNGGMPVTPDSNGTASLQVPVFAQNLLKGTSNKGQDIPANSTTDIVHLTTLENTKYTVAVDIDYSSFPSGSAGATLQVNNGGTVVESKLIAAGTKGRVSVTFTTPAGCLWVSVLLSSNSSYTGKYSCLKASQWQDNNTPPDMTWLPSPDDTGGVKTIDGYRQDSNGNITLNGTYETTGDVTRKLKSKLSTLDQPDFVISTNEILDVDKVASGVFVLNGCSLISSKNGSDTFINVNLSTYNYGWLIVSNYNGAMLERLILTGTFNDVIGVYIRGFNAKNYFNNSFKQILKQKE